VLRFLAGAAACFLFMTSAFLIWQSRAQQSPSVAGGQMARSSGSSWFGGGSGNETLQAPEATDKTKEEKRFSRADKNKDGKIEEEELLEARRKAFAKLDINHNGSLSFEEWAVKTITKFQTADKDRNGWLSAAEYATTAPVRKHARSSCSCRAPERAPGAAPTDDNAESSN
jgi:EF hand